VIFTRPLAFSSATIVKPKETQKEEKMEENKKPEKKEPFLNRAKKKLTNTWRQTKKTAKVVWDVCKENKEVMAALVTATVTVGSAAYRGHEKKVEYDRKKKERSCRIYDPHTGRYLYLKRPMTKKEQREFNAREKEMEQTGETYFDILDDMGILE